MQKQMVWLGIGCMFFVSLLGACQQGETAQDVAEQFMDHIKENETDKAYALLDADMESSIEESDLSYIWTALEMSSGEHESLTYDKTEEDGAHEVVFIEAIFAEGDITFLITVNEDNEVAGFTVV